MEVAKHACLLRCSSQCFLEGWIVCNSFCILALGTRAADAPAPQHCDVACSATIDTRHNRHDGYIHWTWLHEQRKLELKQSVVEIKCRVSNNNTAVDIRPTFICTKRRA